MPLVPVVLLGFLLAAQDKPAEKCTLSGSVVNSVTGTPLNKVEVLAEPEGGERRPAAATFRDAKGNFTMVDLPPGQYRLKGSRNGYQDTFYGARRAGGTGTVIALEAGQEMKDLQIKLLPFGSMSGTVRDSDGEPMVGATVRLLRQRFDGGYRRIEAAVDDVKTDDQGQFRIADLAPGKYYVRAARRSINDYGFDMPVDHSAKSSVPAMVLLPTLYPGVVDPPAARTVEVTSGVRTSGVDVAMVRSRVFRVTVQAQASSGMVVRGVWLYPTPGFENLGLELHSAQNPDGDFEFRGVPPGTYTLAATGRPPGDPTPNGVFTINPYQREFVTRIPLVVGGDLDRVRVTIDSGTEITGHITVDDGGKTSVAGASVSFSDAGGRGAAALVLKDQTFATGLPPGHYQVYTGFHNPPLVIRSIRSERADLFLDGLKIADAGKEKLEIVLAPDGGQVDGVVLDQDDKPVAGATVVLAAESRLRSRTDAFDDCSTDQNGRYHFENVRPGDYKLFAWDDVEPYVWFDPEFLSGFEQKGEPVTLKIKGHETVKLHPITVEK